jgi:superfamily II DNA helicase RecQ
LDHPSRQRIIQKVTFIRGLIRDEEQLKQDGFSFPPSTLSAIPELGEPKRDGLSCTFNSNNGQPCSFVNRHEQLMREHCRDHHSWVNPRKRGQPRRENRARNVPWMENVHCQRFFDHGLHSGYFAVASQPVQASTETPEAKIKKLIQDRIDQANEDEQKCVEVTDKMQQPNPWLRKVRWEHHLKGKGGPDKLRPLIRPVDDEGEEMLAVIHASFDRIFKACKVHATEEVVGESALCTVNAVEYGKKAEDPFYMDMKDNTKEGYTSVWKQMLSFIVRTQQWEPDDRPGYKLTARQKKAWKKLQEQAIAFQDVRVFNGMSESTEKQMQELDSECLELCIQLLDHRLVGDAYENAVISGLSILGFKDGGGWLRPTEYTSNYSAIIKLARALVIEKAHQMWQKQMKAFQIIGCDEDEAKERCESHYELVRKMVDRFMGLEGGRREPTPMDWMISKRTYGMKIRFITTADGTVIWVGETIIYKKVEFSMIQLKLMIQNVVANVRMELMRDVLMIPLDDVGDINEGQVPSIDWLALRDNMAEQRVGWSFLDDVRNGSSVDSPWWLFNRIFQDSRLKKRFVQSEDPIQWRQDAMEEFEQHLVNVQEGLLFICHMTGGPPSRAPSILSIRHRNTANGGLRNIAVENGLMVFTTRADKNFMQRGVEKIIHHYIPQEVSEILFHYLNRALPFWERVQMSVDQDTRFSPFMWGETIKAIDDDKEPDEDEVPNNAGFVDSTPVCTNVEPVNQAYTKVGPWYNQWTSERLSRIIRREALKAMDAPLSISSWRNCVEAISQRFLVHPFEVDKDEEWTDEKRDWYAALFGHSAAMGEDMYGRLMTEAAGERDSDRAKHRFVCQDWHRFLKLPSAIQGSAKASISFYDDASRATQIERQTYMRDTNIQRELHTYMGQQAQFRGEQKQAIQAVMNGISPMLVVMGTGAGKSLIFMLPAFCSHGGTSIVVVPLVSLQDDLKVRCDKSGVTCSIWRGDRAVEAASIVLVTPESAVSKAFQQFVNLLRVTHRLDRIVIDECHTVLASRPNFRPKMRQLGELVRLRIPIVFMTATLRPTDEERFCQSMNIIGKGVYKIRGCTTRPNIRYQVRRYKRTNAHRPDPKVDSAITATVEVVDEMRIKYPAPAKIIVYIRNKKQADKLSEALGCLLYHADVDDRTGKSKRLSEWRKGKEDSRVVVATNALGLGVDVGDTRAVIHIEMPEDLSDFVQESGRAGRDGEPSESIVMIPMETPEEGPARKRVGIRSRIAGQHQPANDAVILRHKNGKPANGEEEEMAAEVNEFINAKCHRVVLDRVMDGRFDRTECEAGEEICSACEQKRRVQRFSHQASQFIAMINHSSSPEPVISSGTTEEEYTPIWSNTTDPGPTPASSGTSEREPEPTPASSKVSEPEQAPVSPVSTMVIKQEHRDFHHRETQRGWIDFHVREQRRDEAFEVQELGRQLQRFKNRCTWCFINGHVENRQHRFEDCSMYGASQVQSSCSTFSKTVQDKRTMEAYSCCYHCYVPQDICQHWKSTKKGGRWEVDKTKSCQFPNVIVPAFWSLLLKGLEETMEWLREWATQDGFNIDDDIQCLKWLGKKVEWGGIEGNKFHQAFLGMAKRVEDIDDE